MSSVVVVEDTWKITQVVELVHSSWRWRCAGSLRASIQILKSVLKLRGNQCNNCLTCVKCHISFFYLKLRELPLGIAEANSIIFWYSCKHHIKVPFQCLPSIKKPLTCCSISWNIIKTNLIYEMENEYITISVQKRIMLMSTQFLWG